ncbi:uncharacterized protein TRAVEDRAFT_37131 [Trametes versicolor FP-101664 SS1]|uniref:uncharacterized protein n=1 Tax=Trametes versicolor (strain FP-101664) TaxID=717944 RepID=UPI0004621B02|nr:uncharacterized protein TRAVEDRAFT_37131 [Trametes versicolor FP-101664 SS1]EIW59913.1 hypothetical protein TRAVEDRAFT_37131 [Trametes versicolor FP-101664 SS1]
MRMKSPEGALTALDSFLDPECTETPYVGDTIPPALKAQAHSCAALAYHEKVFATPAECAEIVVQERRFQRKETMELGVGAPAFAHFVVALDHANQSVQLGLVSPIVLRLGFMMRDIGTSLGVDLSQTVRSRRFRPLWRAVDRRLEEIYVEEWKKQRRVARDPAAYVCAAEGCGIRGEKRQALRSCAGRCPPGLKPRYCSKKCQKQDWSRHKSICKPGYVGELPSITGPAESLARGIFELGDSVDGEDMENTSPPVAGPFTSTADDRDEMPFRLRPAGPGQFIDMPAPNAPGGSIRLTSNTLDAETLRVIRERARMRARGQGAG